MHAHANTSSCVIIILLQPSTAQCITPLHHVACVMSCAMHHSSTHMCHAMCNASLLYTITPLDHHSSTRCYILRLYSILHLVSYTSYYILHVCHLSSICLVSSVMSCVICHMSSISTASSITAHRPQTAIRAAVEPCAAA